MVSSGPAFVECYCELYIHHDLVNAVIAAVIILAAVLILAVFAWALLISWRKSNGTS